MTTAVPIGLAAKSAIRYDDGDLRPQRREVGRSSAEVREMHLSQPTRKEATPELLAELSRIETGHFSLDMERVRIDELVENCINKLIRRARLKDLSLSVEKAPWPLWVLADPLRLEQRIADRDRHMREASKSLLRPVRERAMGV